MNPEKRLHFVFSHFIRIRFESEFNIRFFFAFLFLFSFSLFDVSHVYSQPTQEWVARYLRPASSSAIANQMALDKLGNCYIFGNLPISNGVGGLLTIKYNSNGDTLWTRTYNIGNNSAAVNVAIGCDSVGNTYITGFVGPPPGGPFDIVTIKYSPSGVQQWAKIYAGAGNVADYPYDLKLDKQNNIYVTGASGNQAVTIKYNPSGDTIWVKKFNPSGYSTAALSIGFDLLNNVFIGGGSLLVSQNRNYFMVLKYDSAGNFRWEGTYTGIGSELPHILAVDILGNSFLTGEGSDGVIDGCLTVKFDSSGVRQWQKAYTYNGTGEYGLGNVIDKTGNLYVTGASHIGGSNIDYRTIKYNSNGDTLWVRLYNGPGNDDDEAYAITVDDSTNVYITGRSVGNGTGFDFATVKYNTVGSQQWTIRYNNVGGDDVANGFALDEQKNVIVTGISYRGGQIYDYATIKYSQFTGIEQLGSTIPKTFIIYQNYPNPFNPITKLKFEVAKLSFTQIKIYDILGNEVKVLVNETLHPGIYETDWDASSNASGVYFYRIEAGKFIESKKMVIVK